MNKWKKAISVGMSATLLASLFTVIAASSALAATSVAGVGNVGRGTTSTNAATFTFTEETATPQDPTCLWTALGGVGAPNAPIDLFVTIAPKAPIAGTVQFVGSPTLVAPGALQAVASIQGTLGVNDTLRVRINGADKANPEQISVTGLKVKASSSATLGAIQTNMTSSDGNALASCFLGNTTTATGTVSAAIGISTVPQNLAIALSSGTFMVTGTGVGPAAKLVFATGESVNITALVSNVGGIQTVTIGPTTVVHAANEAVSQAKVDSVPTFPFAMASVGTVTNSVRQDVWSHPGGLPSAPPASAGSATVTTIPNVNPGEQNNLTGLSTYIYERTGVCPNPALPAVQTCNAGLIAKDTVLTFTIDPAGVLFSTSPAVKAFNANTGAAGATGMTLNGQDVAGVAVCLISFDRKSCSIKVTHESTTDPAAVSLYNISLDVDSTVAKGTAVTISMTGVAVAVDYNTIANAARVIVGVAAQPTIFINYNDQPSGMMSLTEAGAGFFQDASVFLSNNVFGLCITSDETFTRAPWAVVSTGDLKLLSGLVGATSVQGTLYDSGDCAYWTVYSISTVASTIDIRGSDSANVVLPAGANNGPRYSVPASAHPGATLVDILVGDKTTVVTNQLGLVSKVSNAVRAYKSGVVVTALSQPTIPAGTTDSKAGNIQISETLAGQFKADEEICVVVLPRTSNGTTLQDTFMRDAITNDLPIITTNGATGLLVDSVGVPGCNEKLFIGSTLTNSFSFEIRQQAFGTLGQITISNIHLATTADAPNGSVLVSVSGGNHAAASSDGVEFTTIVSPARIASSVGADAWIAKGLNTRAASAFGLATVSVTRGGWVTLRARIAGAPAGTLVGIWTKTKTTAWHLETSRRVSTDGYVYYSGHVNNLGYKYMRVSGAGAVSNTVRAFGK